MLRVLSMLLVLGCALPSQAQGPGEQDQCAEAYVASQRARQAGKLREAQQQALFCAREACSRVLRGDCVTWSEELSAQIPSVVFDPRYDDGQAPLALRVTLDGAPLDPARLARAIPLDPGEHRVAVTADGMTTELTFRALEGVQSEPVRVRLRRPMAAPVAAPSTQHRAAWAMLGLTAVGLGSFTALASTGRLRERDLEADCAPDCPRSRGDGITRLYRAADVALGVGMVSGVAGLWLWLRERKVKPPAVVDLRLDSRSARLLWELRF